MKSKNEAFLSMVPTLYPIRDGETVANSSVNPHLTAVMFILTLDFETFAITFPDAITVKPEAFFAAYPNIDREVVRDDHIIDLLRYRDGFARVQQAWKDIAKYEPPPCPERSYMEKLVEFTKHL